MVTAILIVFLLYFILLIFLIEGWKKALQKVPTSSYQPIISIVIAVRNEADNIANLLNDIAAQHYPKGKFEILVVNDRSDDKTKTVAEQWATSHKGLKFHVLDLAPYRSGKKSAISAGVAYANGEIILTTDGDCRVQHGWLSSVAGAFSESTQMVVGAVRLSADGNFFNSLQLTEFASLIGSGGATLAWGYPTLCNGANLAYRKSAFQQVDGYSGNDQVASGDDEFLLRKIAEHFPGSIRFNADPASVVEAQSAPSLTEFFQQRIRWAGKWRAHGMGFSALLASFIFLFHVTVVLLLVLGFIEVIPFQDVALLLGGKMLAEAIFLSRVLNFLRIPFRTASFFVLQFVYPLYVIFFGLAANFFRVSWKGRKI
ncbi:MAG: glycosyltransferase [Cyclobacteriaceae bacterium]|nr:glycosyltransferase [Cyclobacteriaceae bacterium]